MSDSAAVACQGLARMVATHGRKHVPHVFPIHLSTEAGLFGGFPAGGARCSCASFKPLSCGGTGNSRTAFRRNASFPQSR